MKNSLEFAMCVSCFNLEENQLVRKRVKDFTAVLKEVCLDSSNISEHTDIWLCIYCCALLRRCLQFVKSWQKSQEVWSQILQENNFLDQKSLRKLLENYNFEERGISKTCPTKCDLFQLNLPIESNKTPRVLSNVTDKDRSIVINPSNSIPVINISIKKENASEEYNNIDSFDFDEEIILSDIKPLRKIDKKGHAKHSDDICKAKRAKHKKDKNQKNRKMSEEQKLLQMQFLVVHLSKDEQLKEIHRNRLTEKYRNSQFKCEKCGVGFVLEESYQNHCERHLETFGKYPCDVCGLRFTSADVRTVHVRDHGRHFSCLKCGTTVRSRSDCERHYTKCSEFSTPVKCDYCGNYSKNSYALKKHIQGVHLTKKKYICDVCQRTFKRKDTLKTHIRRHTGEKPFQCNVCERKFITHTNLKIHLKIHDASYKSMFYCVECDRRYKSLSNLRYHFARSPRHLDPENFRHTCDSCPQKFFYSKDLEVHVNTHHLKNRLIKCPKCPKAYFTKGAASQHYKRIHGGFKQAKDKVCETCGKAFALKRLLADHARTHTGERPYICKQCPASFVQSGTLYTHVKLVHLNVKRKSSKKNKDQLDSSSEAPNCD